MVLKETTKHMKDLLTHIIADLEKADGGNKAASQRVRTGTVKLEKIAKIYRKDSIKHEKSYVGSRKSDKKSAGKSAPKKAAKAPAKSAHGAKTAAAKSVKVKAKPKAKAHKAVARPRALSLKRPTAKLPAKRASFR